ncbi:hypothetical protein RC26_02540 [Campylobacter jejuni]|nr:hypothetical protein RC26_02540 [Campylobacter jejuni]
MNTLSQNGYIVLNKALIKHFKSLDLACVLSFLIDKWTYFNGDDFYYTIENLQDDTFLSERNVRECIKKLIELEILIKKDFTGLPPKQYYNINYEMVISILNDSVNTCKNDSVNTCKNDSVLTIYNNNKYNNNKINKNKEKKSLKNQALDLFKENEKDIKDFFSFEDWLEWVEYKIKKENKLTILTFSKNIKQLISFGYNAKLSIERSISAGWSGLFEIKQTNKAKAINYDNMFENPNGSDDFWGELIENGEYPSCENRKNLEKNSKNT